jgi:hypothetical protein
MHCIDKGNTRAGTRAPITDQVSLTGRVTILHSPDSPAQRERESFLLRMIRNSNNNENHSYCKRFSIAITARTIIILVENESQ